MEPRTREGLWLEVTTAQQPRGLSTEVWPESSPWKGSSLETGCCSFLRAGKEPGPPRPLYPSRPVLL